MNCCIHAWILACRPYCPRLNMPMPASNTAFVYNCNIYGDHITVTAPVTVTIISRSRIQSQSRSYYGHGSSHSHDHIMATAPGSITIISRSMRSMGSMRGGFIFRCRGPSLKVHHGHGSSHSHGHGSSHSHDHGVEIDTNTYDSSRCHSVTGLRQLDDHQYG
jgi:hypothetical protein